MYVRHRPRQVRQSIYEDLLASLRTKDDWVGWLPRPGQEGVDETLALVGEDPLKVVDYFPGDSLTQGMTVGRNTLAIDLGTPSPPVEYELGGTMAQEYRFNYAIYASSDAVGLALFSDLSDRYLGWTGPPSIQLYNFGVSPPTPVVKMNVESFEYAKSGDQPTPDASLFFAQLILTDYLDQA